MKHPKTRTDHVHAAMRLAIIEQQLAPGARLPEDTIGESFGTSRTIAREALARLAAEGLVDLIPNRGAFVAKPTLDEGRDTFTVRKGLERLVVEQIAANITPEISEKLHKLAANEEALLAKNGNEAILVAGDFHLKLAALTGNALLTRYVTELVSRCSLVLAMYGRPHSADCGVSEHRALIEALVAGDAKRAGLLMDEHLDSVAGRALMQRPDQKPVRDILSVYAERLIAT
jgi:DNA-binding GntR family transcriptional regulator